MYALLSPKLLSFEENSWNYLFGFRFRLSLHIGKWCQRLYERINQIWS